MSGFQNEITFKPPAQIVSVDKDAGRVVFSVGDNECQTRLHKQLLRIVLMNESELLEEIGMKVRNKRLSRRFKKQNLTIGDLNDIIPPEDI